METSFFRLTSSKGEFSDECYNPATDRILEVVSTDRRDTMKDRHIQGEELKNYFQLPNIVSIDTLLLFRTVRSDIRSIHST